MNRRQFIKAAAASLPILGLAGLPHPLLGNEPLIYTVVSGDTLSHIAVRHGTSVAAIKAANQLSSDMIRVGQRLVIPSGELLPEVRRVTQGLGGNMRTWRFIVAHHSATAQGSAASFHNAHLRRGMSNGLAYHFVIGNGRGAGDGTIEIGSRWNNQLQGGHVRNSRVNDQGIGICLVGNFEETRPTPAQLASLHALIGYLRGVVRQPTRVAVHREIDGPRHTLCPGKNFPTAALHRAFPDQW